MVQVVGRPSDAVSQLLDGTEWDRARPGFPHDLQGGDLVTMFVQVRAERDDDLVRTGGVDHPVGIQQTVVGDLVDDAVVRQLQFQDPSA